MSPPTIKGKNAEREAVLETTKFMLVAARTAPKTAGIDDMVTSIVYGEEKDAVSEYDGSDRS